MAQKTTPTAVKKNVFGTTKSAKTASGPHGGGTSYKQLQHKNELTILKDRPGHKIQKGNLK